MKRKVIATLTGAFVLVVCTLNLPRLPGALRKTGGDFNMRYNEVQCIKEGINPYDIWSGAISSSKYYGIYKGNPNHAPEQIHAYSPWEYTYLFPLACLPKRIASSVFHAICLFILTAISCFSWKEGFRKNKSKIEAAFCAVTVLLVGTGLNACFDTQNYGILAAGSIFAMALALRGKHDFLAGVAWAILMTKPQNGVLFAIPLVFTRKWKAFAVAVTICCISILPPALLTHTSPIDLVSCLSKIRSGDVLSTMLFPEPIFRLLASSIGQNATLFASAVLGTLICYALTSHVRFSDNVLLTLFPATLCSLAWTYKMPYDYCILSLPLLVMALRIVAKGSGMRCFAVLPFALVPFLSYLRPGTAIGRMLWRLLRVPVNGTFSNHISIFCQFAELTAFCVLCVLFYLFGEPHKQTLSDMNSQSAQGDIRNKSSQEL